MPAHPIIPADLNAAQTHKNDQQQKDREQTLGSASQSLARNNGGTLIDFHEDLKKDLPSTLQRQDTDTQSLDEFLDAEG
jgi:hypothetical protein